jgi:hypothetical protein
LDCSNYPHCHHSLPSVPKTIFSKVVFTHSCCFHSLDGNWISCYSLWEEVSVHSKGYWYRCSPNPIPLNDEGDEEHEWSLAA